MPTLYRVENPVTNIGLWYNEFGEKTDFIVNDIEDAAAAALPMPKDETIYGDGGRWYSACDSIPQMGEWFSISDLNQFKKKGYGLYVYEVEDYRQVPGHSIFLKEKVIEVVQADFSLLEIG